MSEPITTLVSSKKVTKKKKIGFRPIGKARPKTGKKAGNKASVKASLKSPPPAAKQTSNDNIASKPVVSVTESIPDAETSTAASSADVPVADALEVSSTSPDADQRIPTVPETRQAKPVERKKSIIKPGVKRMTTRKRKHSGITIGSSRKLTHTAKERSKTTAAAAAEKPPAVSPELVEETDMNTNNEAVVAVVPSTSKSERLDHQLLEKLKTEDPGGKSLNSFCSTFKVKRPKKDESDVVNNKKKTLTGTENNDNAFHSNKEPAQRGVPEVQMVDGEIVLQESSLMFPGQRRSIQEVEAEYEVVEEDAQLTIIGANCNSFVNRKKPKHWTKEETKKFYEALLQLGTDFSSMEAFFQDRNRKQLKRKYTTELKKNPNLIEMALNPKCQKNVDLTVFSVQVDKKDIKAAAKLDKAPIPFEPNDVETEQEKKEAAKKQRRRNKRGKHDASDEQETSQEEWEVVQEDAAATAASAVVVHEEAPRTAISARFTAEQDALWFGDEDNANPNNDDIPEPSMENFFQDNHSPEDATTPVAEDFFSEMRQEEESLSLVPNKKAKIKKKPKFRSSGKRKKK